MCASLRGRSRSEQKAIFANMSSGLKKANSYNGFSDKVNSDFRVEFVKALREPIGPTSKHLDVEYKEGIPSLKDAIFTDKTLKVEHTIFGCDKPYDEFWFERKKKRFSNGTEDGYSEGDEITTILV
jgi:hypothetical protein